MLQPRRLGVELAITFPTVMVIRALCVVLPLRVESPKVDIAVVTDPMQAGSLFVLSQGVRVNEPSVTTITVRHQIDMVVVWREA